MSVKIAVGRRPIYTKICSEKACGKLTKKYTKIVQKSRKILLTLAFFRDIIEIASE